MSLMPPWTTRTSEPSAQRSRRGAIWSVRSPYTPQFRNSNRESRRAAQYSYWLRSSSTVPIRSRTRGSESHDGEPAVIESPRAQTTIGIDHEGCRARAAEHLARPLQTCRLDPLQLPPVGEDPPD